MLSYVGRFRIPPPLAPAECPRALCVCVKRAPHFGALFRVPVRNQTPQITGRSPRTSAMGPQALIIRLSLQSRTMELVRRAKSAYSERRALRSESVIANKVKEIPFDPTVFLATVDGGRTISKYRKNEMIFRQGDPADPV